MVVPRPRGSEHECYGRMGLFIDCKSGASNVELLNGKGAQAATVREVASILES